MDRLFLDANVLFSAAYRQDAGVGKLWSLETASLFTSIYAIEEARRNLAKREQKQSLVGLTERLRTVQAVSVRDSVRKDVELPDKDWPILGGALAAKCTHLITGDIKHFGRYFGKRVAGILVLPPADYIRKATRAS